MVTILPNSPKLRISYEESDYKPNSETMNGAFHKFYPIDFDLQMTIKNQLQTKFGRKRLKKRLRKRLMINSLTTDVYDCD